MCHTRSPSASSRHGSCRRPSKIDCSSASHSARGSDDCANRGLEILDNVGLVTTVCIAFFIPCRHSCSCQPAHSLVGTSPKMTKLLHPDAETGSFRFGCWRCHRIHGQAFRWRGIGPDAIGTLAPAGLGFFYHVSTSLRWLSAHGRRLAISQRRSITCELSHMHFHVEELYGVQCIVHSTWVPSEPNIRSLRVHQHSCKSMDLFLVRLQNSLNCQLQLGNTVEPATTSLGCISIKSFAPTPCRLLQAPSHQPTTHLAALATLRC